MDEDTDIIWNGTTITLPRYDSMFVPANAKEITLQKGAHVLLSQPVKGENEMKTILVTGANGYIAAYLKKTIINSTG